MRPIVAVSGGVALLLAAFGTTSASGRVIHGGSGADGSVSAVVRSVARDRTVIVSFRASASASSRRHGLAAVGGRVLKSFRGGTELVRVPSGTVADAVKSLSADNTIRFAEPDYLMSESAAKIPNDPSFNLQWGYRNTGQSVNGISGTAGADEQATPAWGVTTGSRSIVVAEVDSGVDYTHPDLAANIWSNPGGINGCAAGTHGYNVLASTCDPMDDETTYGGHGTHVAGIIGAVGNNGRGVSGVNWQTTILPVKALDSTGYGDTTSLLSALDWILKAKQAGVNIRVVNDSATFVGTAYSQALSDEIDLLGQNDILFVTAAGNTGENNDNISVRRYPCGYDRPTEICVTASNQNDALPSWANYGPATVDLAAPGDNIYSTLRNGTYGTISGGSMASPQVAGAAALILSTTALSTPALRTDILNNVDPVPALSGLVRTGGRLDICKALPGCTSTPPPPPPPANTVLPVISGSAQQGQTLTVSNGSWTNSPSSYSYQWQRCTSSCSPISGATSSSYTAQAADLGDTLKATVTASNNGGSGSATSNPTAAVQSAGSSGSNVAGQATVTASSENASTQQLAVKAVDGFTDGCCSGNYTHEWATIWQQAGAWLNLAWATPQTLSSVVLYDRPNPSDQVLAGTLSFSNGTQVPVGALSNDGSPVTVSFSARTVSWMRFTVTQTSAATVNIGLAEIEAWTSAGPPPPPPPPPPANTVLPVISGSAQQGQTLTVSNGSWTNSPSSYSYQWQRCTSSCSPISGATSSSYTAQAADLGDTLKATVTASNNGGSGSATSNPTTAVQPATTPPPANTVLPVISGSAQQGQTLTVSNGSWTNSPSSYSYQWQRCTSSCSPISGATSSSYTAQAADLGDTLKATVTASNNGGSGSATSNPTTAVQPATTPPPGNTVLPVISGSAQQGQTLTVSNGSWTNSPSSYSYQWQRCTSSCSPISGATSSSYTAQAADLGDTLKATVTASNNGGSGSATSNPTAAVQSAGSSGSNVAGQATVTASSENASTQQLAVKAVDGFTDGCCSGNYTHEWATIWQQAGAWLNLAWATPQTLSSVVLYDRPNPSDQVLAGTLSFSNGTQVPVGALSNDGSPVTVSFSARTVSWMRFTVTQTSAATVNIGLAEIEAWTSAGPPPPPPPPPPANTVLPVISGSAQQGQTLTVSNGSWTNSPSSYSYQWQRCTSSCSPISGATSSSYTAQAADLGDTLKATVTASNNGGSGSATSNPTTAVQPATTPPPANTVLPVISGSAQQGQTLTVSNGSWTNSPSSYSYQWQRCTSSCSPISGATSSSYTAQAADLGDTLKATVTASNNGGSGSATSNPTTAVQPATTTATFGTTTIGANSDPMLANRKRVNHYQLTQPGTISNLSVYLEPTGTSGSQTIQGIIYTDNTGSPGTLLATSTELTFSSTQQAGWYDLTFATPITLPTGTYWIGVITGNTSYIAAFRYSTATNSRAYNVNPYTNGPSTTFGTPTTDNEQMSIYATYTPS